MKEMHSNKNYKVFGRRCLDDSEKMTSFASFGVTGQTYNKDANEIKKETIQMAGSIYVRIWP